jgi:asparagine N-glycosylation enzyme membrane subunit Stt3
VFGAERVGMFFGGVFFLWIISRALVFLFTVASGIARRAYWILADALAFCIAVLGGGYGFADGDPPRFWYAVALFALPGVVLFALDWRKEARPELDGDHAGLGGE